MTEMTEEFQKLTLLIDEPTKTLYVRRDGHMMKLDEFMDDQKGEVYPENYLGRPLTFLHEFTSEQELDDWYNDPITGLQD